MHEPDPTMELTIRRFIDVAWTGHANARRASVVLVVLIVFLAVPGWWWVPVGVTTLIAMVTDNGNLSRVQRLKQQIRTLPFAEQDKLRRETVYYTSLTTSLYAVPTCLLAFAPDPGPVIGLVFCTGALLVAASQHIMTPNMPFYTCPVILLGLAMNGYALGDGSNALFFAALTLILGFNGIILARAGSRAFQDLITATAQAEMQSKILEERVAERTRELEDEKLKLEQSLAAEKASSELQSQFVSMASHEFRTPLTIIDGAARRIDKDLGRDRMEEVPKRVQTIRDSISRMTILIERTLDASKIAAGKISLSKKDFDFAELVKDVVARMKQISPQHRISCSIESCPDTYFGDAKLLDNVLTNIISNGIKYSKDNPNVEINVRQEADALVFSCLDTGVGIPKDQLEHISERFFRASTADGIQGTGIGLNLVKTLVEQHNGVLSIDSEEGKWTKVTVHLPLDVPEAADVELTG